MESVAGNPAALIRPASCARHPGADRRSVPLPGCSSPPPSLPGESADIRPPCTSVAPSIGSATTLWMAAGGPIYNRQISATTRPHRTIYLRRLHSADNMVNAGCYVGADLPGHLGNRPLKATGRKRVHPREHSGRDNITDAHWLPLEPTAPGTGRRQQDGGAGEVKGIRGCGMRMAGCRLHHWQSPFWGVQSALALQTGARPAAGVASWLTGAVNR